MTAELKQDEVRRFFHACSVVDSADEVASILDRECHGNDVLRQTVVHLLQIDGRQNEFLESAPNSLLTVGHDDGFESTQATQSVAEGVGTTIRGYKLLQQIGEGGFGVVYMAQQTEPVKRRLPIFPDGFGDFFGDMTRVELHEDAAHLAFLG